MAAKIYGITRCARENRRCVIQNRATTVNAARTQYCPRLTVETYVADETQQKIDIIIDAGRDVKQEIKSILKLRGNRRQRQCLVKFTRNTENDAVWMTKADL